MANTIKLNHSSTSGYTPSSLAAGEVAINSAAGKVWVGNGSANVLLINTPSYAASNHTHSVTAGQFSQQNFTTTLKNKLDGIAAGAQVNTAHVTNNNQLTNGAGYATTSYVLNQIDNLVDSAPGALNTLNELAAALGDDANYATTITNALAGKSSTSHNHSGVYANASHSHSYLPLSGGNLSGTIDFGSSNGYVNLSRGSFITFYEGGNNHHSISSRSQTGGEADSLRINSYNDVNINLDSNSNNTNSYFRIGRHGAGTGTIANMAFTVRGDGYTTWSGGNSSQANTAYGWGNHASAGYITDGNTGWNNTYGFVTSSGVTSVASGTGITGGTITGTGTLSLALGELPDMTAGWVNGTDEFVVLDNGSQARKRSAEIFGSNAFTSTTIPTNNNQLTNGASYLTTSGTAADSNLLDGIDSSAFLRSNATDTASHRISFQANATHNYDTIATATGSQGSIEVYNNGDGNDAFMSFHAGSDFALYFGLDADTNKLAVGGWSMGAAKYEIYHSGNKPSLSTLGFTGASNANYITNNNQLTNGAGYTTNTGTTTASNSQTFTNKGGNISQWTNNSGYITDGNSGWNNTYGFVTSSGVTSVASGTGITGGTITGTGTLSIALGELPDMTAGWSNGSDEFIVLDNGSQARKLSSEIFGSNAFNSTTIPTNTNQLTNGANFQVFRPISSSFSSTSTTTAASSAAVKSAYDRSWSTAPNNAEANRSISSSISSTSTTTSASSAAAKSAYDRSWPLGTVTAVSGVNGLSGSVTTAGTISLALGNLSDMTQAWVNGSDEFIVLDGGTQKRKLSSEIFGSNAFNSTTIPTNTIELTNGSGFITDSVTTLSGLSSAASLFGGASSGTTHQGLSRDVAYKIMNNSNSSVACVTTLWGNSGKYLHYASGGNFSWDVIEWNHIQNVSALTALP